VRLIVAIVVALSALAPVGLAGGSPVKWPTSRRYGDAMSNPGGHLIDPALRGARPMRDKRERPIKYSGTFSTVFPILSLRGNKYALRVFHPLEAASERHDIAALGQRYAKLGAYFEQLKTKKLTIKELIPFNFVPQGIRVDGQNLPIMKLPWIEGRTMDAWVGRRLGQGRAKALAALATNWRYAMRDLRHIKIAHGDLHHGNVFIESSGQMRLVDYDSMFAPPLAGLPNSEIGHPNYQHPAYHFPPRVRPFDGKMDHFSSIVIYLSLKAIAADPTLWSKFHEEENNLIFSGERDFRQPTTSPVFAALGGSPDAEVRGLAKLLARYATGNPTEVPDLESAIKAATVKWYKK
jgi:hypothetical protein